ncbi:MAG TPA: hypothetical protein PKC30_05390 [Saprospiraceae bacterium]|nr:hypothetical protein [Saprospiraceae bacterium]
MITFKNYSQYFIERKNIFNTPGLYLKPHEVYLDFSVMDEDMLRFEFMPFHGPGYYISEKLKNAIEVQRFTGMAFQEIEKVHPNFRAVFRT